MIQWSRISGAAAPIALNASLAILVARLGKRFSAGTITQRFPWFPQPLRWVSALVDLGGGLLLVVSGLFEQMRQSGFPTTGAYRYLRHPIPIGLIFVNSGLAWLTNRIVFILSALFWVPIALRLVMQRERQLRFRYGPEYDAYRKRVSMVIPDLDRLIIDVKNRAERD